MESENKAPEWALQPEQTSGRGRTGKYHLSKLKLYEVRSIPPELHGNKTLSRFKNYLSNQSTLLGFKFASRQLPDGTIEVCRVK